jgi:hypothetical protein
MMTQNRIQHSIAVNPQSHLKDMVLCANMLYCAHCGKKMGLTSSIKTYTRKDGAFMKLNRIRYICINKCRHYSCDGQTGYSSAKLDSAVTALLSEEFRSDWLDNRKDLIHQHLVDHQEILQQELDEAEYKLKLEEQTLLDLQNEVINVVRGTSAFSSVLLTQLMHKSEANITIQKEDLKRHTVELKNHIQSVQTFNTDYRALAASLSVFAELSLEEKQSVLRRCIGKIYVNRNYEFKIEWAFLSPES